MSSFAPTESDDRWLEKHCTRCNGFWAYKSGRGYLAHDVGIVVDEDGWLAGPVYENPKRFEANTCSETPKKAIACAIEHEIAVLEGKVVELSDAMMELEGKE